MKPAQTAKPFCDGKLKSLVGEKSEGAKLVLGGGASQ